MADLPSMDAIPIIVGVSGHRDLNGSDLPDIRRQVSDALLRLERLTPHSPRLLLSALAVGADQLVAEVALDHGWQVVAAPPMPLDDFINDFETDAAQQHFRDLLGCCVSVRALPWNQELDPDITNHRDQQYRDQGTLLARQAQVIIALWDGQSSVPGACGTAWVVDVSRKGPPPIEGAVLAAPETTGLVHIPVRREKAPDSPPIVGNPVPSDTAYETVLREIDALNRLMAKCRQEAPGDIADSLGWLIPEDRRGQIDKGSSFVLRCYAEADTLARKYQGHRKNVIVAASLMTAIAAACQATYGVMSSQPWIVAYGVAIVLAYVLYYLLFRLPRFKIEERFLEYRAFAEAARVQLFWRLAGMDIPIAEHYLQLVKSSVGWVREAVRAMSLRASLLASSPSAQPELVRERWLVDQINYFFGQGTPGKPGNIARRKYWQARAERGATLSFGFGVLLIGVAGAGYLLPAAEGLKVVASAYSASFFLIAGVIKGFAATMGYAEEVASFEKAGAVFRNTLAYIDAHHGDMERFRACILELGKYALAENADWLLQHRRNVFKIES